MVNCSKLADGRERNLDARLVVNSSAPRRDPRCESPCGLGLVLGGYAPRHSGGHQIPARGMVTTTLLADVEAAEGDFVQQQADGGGSRDRYQRADDPHERAAD